MSPPVPLTPQAWARIRYEYEHTKRAVDDIALEHGISGGTLRDRVRRWGWTPRWGAIPVQGPPALVIPQLEYRPSESCEPSPHTRPIGERLPVPVQTSVPALADHPAATADSEAATIVPQLRSAVASVLPAIEAAIAKFADRSEYPRDIEQTARALNTMTRTLRELNALLGQHRRRW